MPWRGLGMAAVLALTLCGLLAEGKEGQAPGATDHTCPEVLAGVAVSMSNMVGRLLHQYHGILDLHITAMPEKLLLFVSWDFVQVTLGLIEEAYQSACQLLGCGSCMTEWHPATAPALNGNRLAELFERLANSLWIFLDLFKHLDKLPDEEGSRSVLADFSIERAELTIFALDSPQGGILVALGQLLPKLRSSASDILVKHNWCTEVVTALGPIHTNVTLALKLVSGMLIEYRRRSTLWHSFDVPGYLEYFVTVIKHYWFSDLLSFIHNFAHATARSELLFSRSSALCASPHVRLHSHRFGDVQGEGWAASGDRPFIDGTGFLSWHGHSARALLDQIAAAGHPLSYTFWTARARSSYGSQCNTTVEVLYDPTTCLREDGWAGYIYLEVSDPRTADRPQCEYHPRPWQGQSVQKSVWQIHSLREGITGPPEGVDVVALSPLLGNCEMLVEMLSAESMTISKLVYVPFNPSLPPPLVARPNFTDFLVQLWKRSEEEPDLVTRAGIMGKHVTLAQCSLSAISEMLAPLSYRLLQVEHHFAVFVHQAFASVFGLGAEQPARDFEEWRLGWFCSPLSRYLLGLEAGSHFEFDQVLPESSEVPAAKDQVCHFLRSQGLDIPGVWAAHGCEKAALPGSGPEVTGNAAQLVRPGALKPAVERLRRELWSREQSGPGPGQSHLLRAGNKAFCHTGGPCDCLVPYRGPMCRTEDRSAIDDARPYRAAIHYIVNEVEEHMTELLYTLENLYIAFNAEKDYPVLIFHDGLSAETRRKIVLQAPHRIWFFRVHDWIPPDSGASRKMHTKFGLGYMAQSRFRSGPLFQHPAVQEFDYLWTLDSDSHFPGPVRDNPFEHLHNNADLVMGFSYITRTSAASVRGLWEHTILYAMRENIDIWGDALHSNWRNGKTHFMASFLMSRSHGYERIPYWNNQVMMTDCEVLRLSYFRGKSSRYWDYYSYLDSTHGFWSDRWGDHAVRTLGVGMALWEEDRGLWQEGQLFPGSVGWPRVFQMDPPYAHQDHCDCGSDTGTVCHAIHDPKAGKLHERLAPLRKKFWTCMPAEGSSLEGKSESIVSA